MGKPSPSRLFRAPWLAWHEEANPRRRFLWLLVLFSLYPAALVMLPPGSVRYASLDVVAMAFYVARWFPTRRSRRVALVVTGLGSAVLVSVVVTTTASGVFANIRPLVTARQLMLFLAFTAITVAALASILGHQRVTFDTVLGAICVYLLLGAMWGVLYDLVTIHQPDAFRITTAGQSTSSSGVPLSGLSLSDTIYFSYATLTTSGFGDIIPITVAGRTLAWTEAVTGQMYLAVLIARMVSLQIAHAVRWPGGDRGSSLRQRDQEPGASGRQSDERDS
jgi:hypothetical protein